MTLIDILFIILLLFFIFQGFRKGVILELTTMVALIIAVIASLKLTYFCLSYFPGLKDKSPWVPYFAYIIVFICFYILVYAIGKQVNQLIRSINLNIFNRIAGAALGACKVIFIFSFLIWLTEQIEVIPANIKEKSLSYKYFKDIAPAVISLVTSWVPFFKDTISQIEEFFNQLIIRAGK
jgi:membrane protein required for colicin V production